MTQEHKEALLDEDAGLAEKLILLHELVGDQGDFADPVGGTIPVYRYAGHEIYHHVNAYQQIYLLSTR